MKVAHLLARYYPDEVKLGGMQEYVHNIAYYSNKSNDKSVVIASTDECIPKTYTWGNYKVYRYPTCPEPNREPSDGILAHAGFSYYKEIIQNIDADIIHQHQFTPKCGIRHAMEIKKRYKIPLVMSIHVVIPFCVRETLLYKGEIDCDGPSMDKCIKCLNGMVSKRILYTSWFLSKFPRFTKTIINHNSINAVTSSHKDMYAGVFTQRRIDAMKKISQTYDAIIVHCTWMKDMIERMHCTIPIHLIPYGIRGTQKPITKRKGKIRFVFVGRLCKSKGIIVLLDALKYVIEKNYILDIYGIKQDDTTYKQVLSYINKTNNAKLLEPVPNNMLSETLTLYDCMIVPSLYREPGPLVIQYAFQANLKLIASNTGGISEQLYGGLYGKMVKPGCPLSLASAIAKFIRDKDSVPKPGKHIAFVNNFINIRNVYQSLL